MRIPALICLSFFITSLAFSQDDLVDITYVNFHSALEKTVIMNHVRKAETDYFSLSIASGSLLNDARVNDAKSKFYEQLSAYKTEKFLAKKNDKKIKQIYNEIHKSYLKKFQHGSSFEDIFFNGNYDNVSASLLYALVFDELKIPYVVKEEPENVYLLAYPDAERIKVEAASPVNGLVMVNFAFKEQYVKALKEQKLISASEASAQNTEALFDKYYYGNQQSITLLNLLGLQYLNDSEERYNEQGFDGAYAQAEKAYVFYPCSKTSYSLVVTGSQSFQARKQLDSLKALQLGKLSKYKDHGITNDMVSSEFVNTIQELLFERGKRNELEVFYRVLTSHVDDVELQSELKFLYNYEIGRYLFNQGKYKDAVLLFETAVASKPDKQDAINALISSIANTMASGTTGSQNVAVLEEYSKKYPSLHTSDVFNNLILSSYLIQVVMEFGDDNFVQGEKYRGAFEELKKKYPDVTPNPQLVGEAYSRAAVYFYRKGQTSKAKNLIEMGLKYSPGNYELMSRKRMIQ